MLKPTTSQSARRPRQAGFTLIEMMVAVALVLLIMLLLANVFSLAATTATKQKGTAENDQQARTFTTIIQGDICARTFIDVIPFHAIPVGADIKSYFAPDVVEEKLARRRGYFCVSENNPNSQKDDVLSLTVDYNIETNKHLSCVDKTTFDIRARAVILGPSGTDPFLFNNPNQPEGDDGFPSQNQAGLSTKAEVCYFLRDGNLHRRVMLLRDQYVTGGTADGQPTAGDDTTALVTGDYPPAGTGYSQNGSGVFWRDFDYSVFYNSIDAKPWFLIGAGETLLGPLNSSLDNSVDGSFQVDFDGDGIADASLPLAVGIPHFRFGHNVQDPFGRPREFLNAYSFNVTTTPPAAATGEQNFIGRFTTQETAHATFTYPGNLNNGNPMAPDPTDPFQDVSPRNGVVDRYDGLNRRGDDILLTNVIEFDVKVWDDIRNQFVDLGNSGGGQFSAGRNQNPDYGNTFDTWHWRNELGVPPYWPGNRPGNVGPDGAPGAAGVDEDGDGVFDYDASGNPDQEELGWIGTDDEVPLKAIQITIRYTDPTSGLVRQVTLLNSLLD